MYIIPSLSGTHRSALFVMDNVLVGNIQRERFSTTSIIRNGLICLQFLLVHFCSRNNNVNFYKIFKLIMRSKCACPKAISNSYPDILPIEESLKV